VLLLVASVLSSDPLVAVALIVVMLVLVESRVLGREVAPTDVPNALGIDTAPRLLVGPETVVTLLSSRRRRRAPVVTSVVVVAEVVEGGAELLGEVVEGGAELLGEVVSAAMVVVFARPEDAAAAVAAEVAACVEEPAGVEGTAGAKGVDTASALPSSRATTASL
jgi:hypothetical protein